MSDTDYRTGKGVNLLSIIVLRALGVNVDIHHELRGIRCWSENAFYYYLSRLPLSLVHYSISRILLSPWL